MSSPGFIHVRDLTKTYDVSAPWLQRALGGQPRKLLRAVQDVSFDIERGTTLGVVGESGCGKSTIAKLVVGLQRPTSGQVRIGDAVLHDSAGSVERQRLQRRVQMIFQDPHSSLNPRWRVSDIVAEPLRVQDVVSDRAGLRDAVTELLTSVGLSPNDAARFPHEFSGGQRQRIAIARALATKPSFLVCDEPTSALDVSVQAQVLNLMRDLQHARDLTFLFISHNLAVVRHVADRVAVMYLGRIVELADKAELFARPRHPYTRMLLAAVPSLHGEPAETAQPQGEVPNPLNPPTGCAFHPRCPSATDRCRIERPVLAPAGPKALVACHLVAAGGSSSTSSSSAPASPA